MKKHLIAAAVAAAVAAPAMAQNVTMSGLIDIAPQATLKNSVGAASVKGSGTSSVSGWSTSTIAFTASEDLGGGMKASATVSSFFDSGANSPANTLSEAGRTAYHTIGGRDRFLRLDGGFGALQFGRFTPAINGYCGYACAGGTNNNAGTTDSTGSDLVQGTLSGRKELGDPTVAEGQTVRNNTAYTFDGNAIARNMAAPGAAGVSAAWLEHQSGVIEFTTPSMNGFNAVLSYVNGKNDDSAPAGVDKATQTGIRLNYAAGPLAASLATASRKAEIERVAADGASKVGVNWLGASYNFGAAQVFVSHGTRKDKFTNLDGGAEVTLANVKVNTVGIQVPVGAVTLNFSMYDGTNKQVDDPAGLGDVQDRDLKGHQIAARYALSKRTFAYAVTGVNKDTRKNTALDNDDFKRSQTQFGVVHSF